MSKKTFMSIRWKEVAILFVTDLFIMGFLALQYNSGISVKIGENTSFLLIYLSNFGNIFYLAMIVFIVNFLLSGIWHFVIRK